VNPDVRHLEFDDQAAATGLSLFDATIELCEQLHREVPWRLKKQVTPVSVCELPPVSASPSSARNYIHFMNRFT
jgi:hypothetical protein